MDKPTAILAEQVGVFLAPMMRAMIVAAFKESGLAAKIETLTLEHDKLVSRVQDHQAALERGHRVLADGQDRLQDQIEGKAGVDLIEALRGSLENLAATADQKQAETDTLVNLLAEEQAKYARDARAAQVSLSEVREELLHGVEDANATTGAVKEVFDALRVSTQSALDALAKTVGTLDARVGGLAASQDANRAELLEAVEAVKQVSAAHTEALVAAVPVAPTVFQLVDSCKGLIVETVDGAVHKAVSDAVQQSVTAAVAALPPPKQGDAGPVGLMPLAEPYVEGRIYERAAVVFYAGGTWQATRPTKTPPASNLADWQTLMVGVAGLSVQAGADARLVELKVVLSDGTEMSSQAALPTMVYRGVYDAEKTYVPGDTVTQDGSVWYTDKTSVGCTPTQYPEQWKLAVKAGKTGARGKDGADGVQFKAGYAGEYEEDKVYPQNSIVTYASSIWLAKRPTKERPPYLTNADSEHWLRVR